MEDHELFEVSNSCISDLSLKSPTQGPSEPVNGSANPSPETRSQASTSKNDQVSDKSGIKFTDTLTEDDVSLNFVEESGVVDSRTPDAPEIAESDEASATSQETSFGDEKNLPILTNAFKYLHDRVTEVKSMSQLMEDRDVNVEEVFVQNPIRSISCEDESSSSDQQYPKEVPSTSTDEDSHDYVVHASEAAISKRMNKGNSDRYRKNLRKFLRDRKVINSPAMLSKKIKKSTRRNLFYRKLFKSEGALSSILNYCGAVTKVSSVVQNLQLRRISNSAPPSFNDESRISHEMFVKEINSESSGQNRDFSLKLLRNVRLPDEAVNVENNVDVQEKLGKAPDNSERSILTEIHNSLEKSTAALQEVNASPEVFKVPIRPKPQEKFPESVCSPINIKINTKSRSCSPRRPTDLNLSPRQSVYVFCPGSPSGLLRQCRSLPNIGHAPKKVSKRESMEIGNRTGNKSVKALFSGEMTAANQSSSTADPVLDDNESSSPKSEGQRRDMSVAKSKIGTYNVNHCSESSEPNALHPSNKMKSRKKLTFTSGDSESTNNDQTLQDSCSSLDISEDVSKLDIEDAAKPSSVKISLIESPPKRKLESPDSGVPQSQLSSPKKYRLIQEEKTAENKGIDAEGFLVKAKSIDASTFIDRNVSAVTPIPSRKTDDAQNIPDSVYCVKGCSTNKPPTVHFPEETDSDSAPKRMLLKRTQIMSSDIVEDITNDSSDPKRKKEVC